MKQAILDWQQLYNWRLLAAMGLAWMLAAVLRALLNKPVMMPRARTWLLWLWVPSVVGFGVTAALRYHNNLLSEWYILFTYGVAVAILWCVRTYRPAAIMLWALTVPTIFRVIGVSMELANYRFQAPYNSYYQKWSKLNFLWFSAFIFLAFYQKKTLAKQQAQREEEERQLRLAAAHKDNLERLVAARTVALTQQADELQAALAELRATQQQLIQREKMASLGELTAGIAHEIQNPLNFVNNFADVSAELVTELEAEQASPTPDTGLEDELLSDLRHNLHKINQHGQRAASIVRGMLAHSRQSTGERQPTDVNALADEYLRLAYHGLRAKDKSFNATLNTEFAPVLPLVPAVSGDLGRVLLNLFTNAFYAVQKRQLAVGPGYAPTVQVRTRRAGEEVEICIRDNGTGIPAAVRSKIFQPFFTTKPSGEGTGLGLSLAHDIIVQGHSGTLAVESQEGEYTEFVVRLPFR